MGYVLRVAPVYVGTLIRGGTPYSVHKLHKKGMQYAGMFKYLYTRDLLGLFVFNETAILLVPYKVDTDIIKNNEEVYETVNEGYIEIAGLPKEAVVHNLRVLSEIASNVTVNSVIYRRPEEVSIVISALGTVEISGVFLPHDIPYLKKCAVMILSYTNEFILREKCAREYLKAKAEDIEMDEVVKAIALNDSTSEI